MKSLNNHPAIACSFFKNAFLLVFCVNALYAGDLIKRSTKLLYADSQMPFNMDGSFATLKNPANPNELFFFETNNGCKNELKNFTYKYAGPPDLPLSRRIWAKRQSDLFGTSSPGSYLWIYNIYKCPDGSLLGFLHIESPVDEFVYEKRSYSIGLAWSSASDYGDTWIYCGEIIRPQDYDNHVKVINTGGVPYLVVGDYFYVYFREQPLGGGTKRLAVARAKVDDVLNAAKGPAHSVTPWQKYDAGSLTHDGFAEDGLAGLGSDILPDANQWAGFDVHQDAAYNTVLKQFMITLNVRTARESFLNIYVSSDGLSWANGTIIDQCATDSFMQYSFFAATQDASDDCREVGKNFKIIYPKTPWAAIAHNTLFSCDFNAENSEIMLGAALEY